jgi:hypothetical protein
VPPLFFTNYIILKKFFIKNLFFAQALGKGEMKKRKKIFPSPFDGRGGRGEGDLI